MNDNVKKLGEEKGVEGEGMPCGISMMREEESHMKEEVTDTAGGDALVAGPAIKEREEDVALPSETAMEGIENCMIVQSSTANEKAGSNILDPSSGEGKGEKREEKCDEKESLPVDGGDDHNGGDGDDANMNINGLERTNQHPHDKAIAAGIGTGAANAIVTATSQPTINTPPSSNRTENSYMEVEENGAGVDDTAEAEAVERSPHISPSEPEFQGEGEKKGAVSSLAFMSGLEAASGTNKPGQLGASGEGMTLGVEIDRGVDGIQKQPDMVVVSEEDAENYSSRPIRELKVEDALLYLDQVKIEFGDQPEIYNEFLDIMKNFKEQNIDTPGVINRVSSLFRGYNKLVLGFNTFLPEGYKIDLRDIEEMNRAHEAHEAKVHEAKLAAAAAEIIEAGRMSNISGTPLSIGMPPQRGLGNVITSQIDQLPTSMYGIMGGGVHRGIGTRMGLPSHLSAMGGTIKNQLDSGVGMNLLPSMSIHQPQYSAQGAPLPHAAPKTGGPLQQHMMTMGNGMVGGRVHPTSGEISGGIGEQHTEHDRAMTGYGTGMRTTGVAPGVVSGSEQPAEFDHAISYVTTIKKRFIGEPLTYKSFLEILHKYQKEQKGINEVLEQVSALFADHPDLLREFTYFLPDPVQDQARVRLNRAAKESEMRRVAQQMSYTTRKEEDWNVGGSKLSGAPSRGKTRDRKPKNRASGPGYPYGAGSAYSSSGMSSGGREGGDGGWDGDGVRTLSASGRHRGAERGEDSQVTASVSSSLGPSAGMQKDGKYAKQKPGHKFGGLSNVPKPPSKRPERVLFAAVKEVLTDQGHESWQEFLKCVELYSIEVLTKAETLALVVDLFGPNTNLYADFKRLMEAIDGDSGEKLQTDMWYSTPLSEVDFSQCRKCTPSYRALPKDYPLPASSERTIADQSVLNDTFVSVPVGSEESWSFKQQRRNQYEEALFAYEDERFQVDIIIDSTISTIKLLDPLVEEISQIQAQWGDEKEATNEHSTGDSPVSSTDCAGTGGGGSGKASNYGRFQYKLDRRAFGTIHLAAMARVYGEHGAEMLELLRKNPAGCIPIVTKRLKQKLVEWQKVRNDLNRQWQEVVQDIYSKSLDRRSYFFKQQERKRLTSKALIDHIKNVTAKARSGEQQQQLAETQYQPTAATTTADGEENGKEAVNGSNEENQNGDAAVVREGGEKVMDTSDNSKKSARPERVIKFDISDLRSQSDAYRLVNAAIDHLCQGEVEREKLRGVWKDTMYKWLQLPQYLQYHGDLAEGHVGYEGILQNTSSFPVNSKGRGNTGTTNSDGDDSTRIIPVGSRVMTSFGEGPVKSIGPPFCTDDGEKDKNFFVMDLNYASSILAPDSILGLLPQLGGGGERNGGGGGGGNVRKRQRGKKGSDVTPVKCKDNSSWKGKEDMLLGPADMYVLLRLWQVLVSRLKQARTLCIANDSYPQLYPENHPFKPIGPNGEVLSPKDLLKIKIDQHVKSFGLSPSDYPPSGLNSYEGLLVMVVASLPCANDKSCALAGRSKLEDSLQFLLGNDSYMLFTLDKLLLNIGRQLQKVCDDEMSSTLIEVWNTRHATLDGKGTRESYLAAVGKALAELQETSGSAVPRDVYSFSVLFENSVRCAPESLSIELLGHIDADGKVLADEEDDEEEEATSEEKQSEEAEGENDASIESPQNGENVEGDGPGSDNMDISLSEGGGDAEAGTEASAPNGDVEAEKDNNKNKTIEKNQQDDKTTTTANLLDMKRVNQKRGFTAVSDNNNSNSSTTSSSQQQTNEKERYTSKRRRAERVDD